MPTPPKTSPDAIVSAARDLIARHGVEALTMQSVAEQVGVRGPSLYKHFADRNDLLRAVEWTVVAELEGVLAEAGAAAVLDDDLAALRNMAAAYRRFAKSCPSRYGLIFSLQSQDRETEAARRKALAPALRRLENWLGDSRLAFVRARAMTAFLHGFVSMEAGGHFRFGGSVDEAFAAGVDLFLSRPDGGVVEYAATTGARGRPTRGRPAGGQSGRP